MKIINFVLILIFFSSCSSAQNYKLIEVNHFTTLGEVKVARSENFSIIVRSNSKIEPKYLLVDNVKIPLQVENKKGVLYLKGIYLPESPYDINVYAEGEGKKISDNQVFDLNHAYLISENMKNKKLIKQKLNFNNSKNTFTEDEKMMNNERLSE